MSLEAILLGTESHLKAVSPFDADEVSIMPSGRPKAVAGQRFVAVYPISWLNLITGEGDSVEGYEEVFSIGVCVTFRFGYSPEDRTGRELVMGGTGLLRMARQVMLTIHGNYDLVNLANAQIPGTENKIGEPLTFRSGRMEEKGPDWFESTGGKSAAGYAVTMEFKGGKRLQPL